MSRAGYREYSRRLKPEEMAVLREMSYGKRRKVIAKSLGLTAFQINRIRRNLFDKLGADTQLEAVMFALDMGVLNPFEFYGS